MINLNKRIKAVIFDLDDTLISEQQYIESGFRHIAEVISTDPAFYKINKEKQVIFKMLMKLFYINSCKVFSRLFNKLQIYYSEDDIVRLVEEYRNHMPSIHFYDDVLPCLDKLKKNGIKVGIITDGYAVAQRNKLKAIDAYDLFNQIIITDELGREYWKPHPKAYQLMRENLKVEFQEIIYIGDNPEKDFFISSIYPITTVRIYRGGVHQNKEYLNNIKEDYTIKRLSEIGSLLFD